MVAAPTVVVTSTVTSKSTLTERRRAGSVPPAADRRRPHFGLVATADPLEAPEPPRSVPAGGGIGPPRAALKTK